MTQKQFKALDPKVASHREELIRSQQGELNAVLMYQRHHAVPLSAIGKEASI